MAFTVGILAATLTLFSSALAFSPDQCNVTTYGSPSKAACTTLLANIAKLGVGNTSYLFIPEQFPTPAGLSNGSRKNFPQSWSTTGCNAALVPVEVTDTSVTYDTSSYQDLAAAGQVVVQQCISNVSRASGGWELAGDEEDLVLHIYATGSQIDKTIKQQTQTTIAATSEDEIDAAEIDDPAYNYGGNGTVGGDGGADTGTGSGSTFGSSASGALSASQLPPPSSAPATASSAPPAAPKPTTAPQVVQSPGTFDYFGCEMDDPNSRSLSSLQWSGDGLTVERCAAYCSAYQYMGVEFGSQCFCGGDAKQQGVKPATIVTSGLTNCTTPCNGNAAQACGGDGWLNLYQNRNSATAGESS